MYELKFEDKDHYLQVTVSGDLNPETDIAIDVDIRKECEHRDFNFALIDIRTMTSRITTIENHIAAKSFSERMGPEIRAIAIVVDSIDFDKKSKMYEVTARNRGADVKFFTQCEVAASWLLDK